MTRPPLLPVTGPMTVQFVVNDDVVAPLCFEATYSALRKNDAGQVKTKSD